MKKYLVLFLIMLSFLQLMSIAWLISRHWEQLQLATTQSMQIDSLRQFTANIVMTNGNQQKTVLKIDATGYNPVSAQTDSTPYSTACGFNINKRNPLVSRFLGLPRMYIFGRTKGYNLKSNLHYGDTLLVQSTDKRFPYWGLWILADCTNKMINRADFCIGLKDTNAVFRKIKIMRFVANF